MARGIFGVVAGYGLFAVSAVLLFQSTGQDPHGDAALPFVVFSGLYALAFATLAGRFGRSPSRRSSARATDE